MPITALPTPPSRADSTNFAARGDTFMSALPAFATEANTLQTEVNAKETSAAASAGTATTKAAEALASANTATSQASTSTTKASESSASAAAAAASYDSFDDRYLGAKATGPTLDNDGAALLVGALYWDTAIPGMRAYTGTAWTTLPAATAGAVANTPAGGIAATTVQAAINELDTEKLATNGVVTNLTGTASININGTVGATTPGTVAATTIAASGLVSANAGLAVTGTLNTTGNVGIAAALSTWGQGSALEIGAPGNSLWGNGLGDLWLICGAYYNAGFKYSGTTKATAYRLGGGVTDGTHYWSTAPSGTAGAAATFTDRMVLSTTGLAVTGALSATGNVGIGTTAPVGKLDVSSGGAGVTAGDLVVDTANKTVFVGRQSSVSGDNTILSVRSRTGDVWFKVDPSNGLSYFPLGNVLIGTATDAATGKLQVTGNVAVTGALSATGVISSSRDGDGSVNINYSAATTWSGYSITEANVLKAIFGFRGASAGLGTRNNTLEINALSTSDITFRTADIERGRFSSTGLAVTGALSATTTIKTGGYTVATLPAGVAGDRAYITDATTPTWNAALTGGGAVVVPVFRNATVWVSA